MRIALVILLSTACAPALESNVDPGIVVKSARISEISMVSGGLVVAGEYGTGILTVLDDTDTARDHDVVITSSISARGVTAHGELGDRASSATYSLRGVVTTPDLFGRFRCVRLGMSLVVGASVVKCQNDAGVRLSFNGVRKGVEIDMFGIGELTIGTPE